MERYLCSQFFIVFLEIYTHMHTHTTETEHDLLSFWILNQLLRVELQCIMSVTEEVFTEAYRVHSEEWNNTQGQWPKQMKSVGKAKSNMNLTKYTDNY